MGLTACVNAVHAVALAGATGLAAAPTLWRIGPVVLLGRTAVAAGSAVLGCLPYLHLVWVSGKTDRFVWGDLSSPAEVGAYLLGADYAHTDHSSWLNIGHNLIDWLAWASLHGAGPLFLLGFVGLLLNPWCRGRAALWATPLIIASLFSFTYGVFYPEVPDFSAYLLPALWWTAVGVAANLNGERVRFADRMVRTLTMGALLLALLFGTHLNRSGNDLARQVARTWLESLPQQSIILLESDHLVFPAMYLQAVEGVRPDVVVLNVGFAASRWYWSAVYRAHPKLNPIEIARGDRGVRLRSFLLANRDRPHYAESIELAGHTRIRPCLATWGVALGQTCANAPANDAQIFSRIMDSWWREQVSEDPISGRVLAHIGLQRAKAAAAMGQYGVALFALRDGVPPGARPQSSLPDANGEPVQFPVLDPNVLIGHPHWNLRVGETLLKTIALPTNEGIRSEWRDAALDPANQWP